MTDGLRGIALAVIAAALVMGGAPRARAQTDDVATYPNRPIHIVAAAAAGGTMDVVARLVGQKLSERFGQPVIIDNRPGASTIVGTEYVARAPADGYTLLSAPLASIVVNPAVYPKLRYGARDFAPISMVGSYPFILAVTNSAPVHSVRELIDYTKAHPEKANAGGGTVSFQLMTELFKQRTGAPIQYIPYKGMSEVTVALISGELLMSFVTATTASQIKGGNIRALAVAAPARIASFPDLPTLAEAGLPDMSAVSWAGIVAPARTPEPIVKKLEREIVRIVQLPDIQAKLRLEELDPVGNSSAEFARIIADDLVTWSAVAKAAHISLEQ
ncbi:MAG TPA: tripartite tricarboxylate transporter substrate binding protein [Xanthobacteraceae bacterium]|jgi:tripartite-type tricarboxylate transporter receptor subunit TctC